MKVIVRPTVETVITIHSELIRSIGGSKANGIEIACTNEELAALGWGLADGSVTKTALAEWIVSHS